MKKPTKKWIIILAVILILAVIGQIGELIMPEKEKPKREIVKPKELSYKEQFQKKHFSSWDGSCRPVEKFLKENLNDPSSLEIERTWLVNMNQDSTFNVKTLYRAKNAYNAIVKESIYCRLDMDGNLYDIKVE